jgi:hypothetical protein
VYGAGDQFLADAALARHQHVARRAGRQRDLLAHGADRVALAHQRVAGSGRLRRPPHEPVLPDGVPVLEQALHPLLEIVEREGLFEVVARPATKRGDGRLERGVGGHHDDRRPRIEDARALEQVEPVETGHHDVGEDDVEVLLRESREGLFAARGRRDVVALGGQGPGENVLDCGLVVYDED